MKYKVVFVSKTGNTEKLAKVIYEAIPDTCKDIQRLTDQTDYEEAETLFVGFWTDRGTCSIEVLNYLSELHGKNVALFGTCGMGGEESYFHKIEKQVSVWIPDDNHYCGTYLCQGRMPISVRNKYGQMAEDESKAERAQKMIRNYDEALLHPNAEDFQKADIFVKHVMDMLPV